jgi:predicted CoA-substrate-specific enzyme activase
MISLGYDIGTRFIKTCIVDDGRIISSSINENNGYTRDVVSCSAENSANLAGIKLKKINRFAVTGFGHSLVEGKIPRPSIETCAVLAAKNSDIGIRTIVDAGGLFLRLISINDRGIIDDVVENEKCAAGSGRFLEMASSILEVPFGRISERVENSQSSIAITSGCSVFAESEIISLVNSGKNPDDIIAGIILSIAVKTNTMLVRIAAQDKIVLIGGLSQVPSFLSRLKSESGKDITLLPFNGQIAASYGAALYALKNKK